MPVSQLPSFAETAGAAASKALAGKDLAAKLAADFAQQHRSKQSSVGTTAGQHPVPINLSVALASAVTEKVLNDRDFNERAVRAKAAAEKHIHEQAVRAKQSLQGVRSSEDVHAARMEALRLRNAARHDSPQAPPVLPVDHADQPTAATAAMPDAQPAAAPAAAPGPSTKSQTLPGASIADSRLTKKRGREEDHMPWVGQEAALELPGPPAGNAASLSRRERTASPASAGSRDSLRRRGHSADSRQV